MKQPARPPVGSAQPAVVVPSLYNSGMEAVTKADQDLLHLARQERLLAQECLHAKLAVCRALQEAGRGTDIAAQLDGLIGEQLRLAGEDFDVRMAVVSRLEDAAAGYRR